MTATHAQLIQEVEELTEMMRTEDTFADVRSLLAKHGISSAHALLAGYIENAEWHESGAIVTSDGRIFAFERIDSRNPKFSQWQTVAEPDSLLDTFPAITVAVQLSGA